jgi:sterol desaturase/sphingolipid hydroxylase (fatty acid hydroxylase superfamily)
MEFRPTRSRLLTYGLYPLVVGGATAAASIAVATGASRSAALPAILVSAISLCLLVERLAPLERRWAMTARTFVNRDLPYIAAGLGVERLCEVAVAAIVARTVPAGGFGPLGALPLALQVIVAVLAFDLGWYWYHRRAHRRARLWRVHGAHHSPTQLYVLMHGVFHPFDELVVRFVLALGVFRLGGFSPDATFIALVAIGAVGIISHVNADVRLWAFNHLLIGPETHRYHHSADHQGNYGTVTSLWDQVFGTFVFHPTPPAMLGPGADNYPDPERFLTVLAWPLRS